MLINLTCFLTLISRRILIWSGRQSGILTFFPLESPPPLLPRTCPLPPPAINQSELSINFVNQSELSIKINFSVTINYLQWLEVSLSVSLHLHLLLVQCPVLHHQLAVADLLPSLKLTNQKSVFTLSANQDSLTFSLLLLSLTLVSNSL